MIRHLLLSRFLIFSIIYSARKTILQFNDTNKSVFLIVTNYYFGKNMRVFSFYLKYRDIDLFKFSFFFRSWHLFFIKKIKFRHRITWFKMLKSDNLVIRFNLGLSHYTYARMLTLRLFRRKKYLSNHTIVFWATNHFSLFDDLLAIKNLQPISPYCLRGFKFARGRFIKRPGKMSKYTHLKNKIF